MSWQYDLYAERKRTRPEPQVNEASVEMPLHPSRPPDKPAKVASVSDEKYSFLLIGLYDLAEVGPGPQLWVDNMGEVKPFAQCAAACRAWFHHLDHQILNPIAGEPDFLTRRCSPHAESFMRVWQSGCLAGHKEFMLERFTWEVTARANCAAHERSQYRSTLAEARRLSKANVVDSPAGTRNAASDPDYQRLVGELAKWGRVAVEMPVPRQGFWTDSVPADDVSDDE